MDADENDQPISLTSKLKPFSFYFVPILCLSLAIFFSLTPKTQLPKPTPSSDPKPCLLWMSPFLSGGGYSSEGWSYISALHRHVKNPSFRIAIKHHGDSESVEFWDGLPQHLKSLALDLHTTECRPNETVVVCHSEPGAWNPLDLDPTECRSNETEMVIHREPGAWNPLDLHATERRPNETEVVCHREPGAWNPLDLHATECRPNETVVVCHSEPGAWNPPLLETSPCPPTSRQNYYRAVIGRTMFETDRVSPKHVARCNRMDYVWVPTEFHVDAFVSSGVDRSKVVKIFQSVDTEFFDPVAYKPLDLESLGNLVLGSKKLNPKFVFFSVFKWEYRKGWDILLRSYLEEFSADDDVALFLLTNPYHSDRDFSTKIIDFVGRLGQKKPIPGWAPVHVIDRHVAQTDLPRLYKAANAFVLPSRGEGWGRPIVEAMAMELPVIATCWSGPTEYMTQENSYPLAVSESEMSQVSDGPFKGHLWAEPSIGGLRILMRRVVSNVDEAKRKGKRAREDMVTRFSPEIIAGILADRVQDLLQRE